MNCSHLASKDSVRVEQEVLVDWTKFCIEGVLLPVLAIFGILGEKTQYQHFSSSSLQYSKF